MESILGQNFGTLDFSSEEEEKRLCQNCWHEAFVGNGIGFASLTGSEMGRLGKRASGAVMCKQILTWETLATFLHGFLLNMTICFCPRGLNHFLCGLLVL